MLRSIGPDLGFSIINAELVTLGAGDSKLVFDKSKDRRLGKLIITNVGTGTFKYAYNSAATANYFHDIVAGGAADEDGTGGRFQVSREDVYNDPANFDKFYIFSDAGTKVVIQRFVRNDCL